VNECHYCCIFANNITNIGYYGKQVAGVFIATSGHINVSNNIIGSAPRAGICINDGYIGGHSIEYNRMWDLCTETADHGAFNSWGRDRYWTELFNHPFVQGVPPFFPAGLVTQDAIFPTVIRNNFITYYTSAQPGNNWGMCFDLDDGSSNYIITENVCVGSNIKIGSTGDIFTVSNNVVVDPIRPMLFWHPMINNYMNLSHNIAYYSRSCCAHRDHPINISTNAMFANNKRKSPFFLAPPTSISTYTISDSYVPDLNPILNPSYADYNLFYYELGGPNFIWTVEKMAGLTFQQWQFSSLNDWNSLLNKDPEFEDLEHENFHVSNTSPALQLGFHNFDYGPQCITGTGYRMNWHR